MYIPEFLSAGAEVIVTMTVPGGLANVQGELADYNAIGILLTRIRRDQRYVEASESGGFFPWGHVAQVRKVKQTAEGK